MNDEMSDEEFYRQGDYLRKRKRDLMKPLNAQIMMTDNKNEVLILAAAMVEKGYSIFKEQYGREGAIKLLQTMTEIVDERDQ
jgi:coenzyme F420-reducing hydrogenase delta subunit